MATALTCGLWFCWISPGPGQQLAGAPKSSTYVLQRKILVMQWVKVCPLSQYRIEVLVLGCRRCHHLDESQNARPHCL